MATLSDLKEVKEALDAGLVSQADYDDVKRDYLRAKKKALEAKEESQKKELRTREEFQRRKLVAKETFQKRKRDAKLRTSALEAIVKHGASLMSEEQKVDLVRDYAKLSGLDRGATKAGPASKRQKIKAEKEGALPSQPSTSPAVLPAPAAPPSPADAAAPAAANRAPAPVAPCSPPPPATATAGADTSTDGSRPPASAREKEPETTGRAAQDDAAPEQKEKAKQQRNEAAKVVEPPAPKTMEEKGKREATGPAPQRTEKKAKQQSPAPRKEVPAFGRPLGMKCKVYWPEEDAWFHGMIKDVRRDLKAKYNVGTEENEKFEERVIKKAFFVRYDDGDRDWLQIFKFSQGEGEEKQVVCINKSQQLDYYWDDDLKEYRESARDYEP